MSATIYDSSLITKLKASKAESNSFLTRQRAPNFTTSYGAPNGIYDESIMNPVKIGQMSEVRKANGGYTVYNGCPQCNNSPSSVSYTTN